MTPGQVHQLRVGELVADGAHARGWRAAIKGLVPDECHEEVPKFYPDAFLVDGEDVTAYEVMVTHFVDDEKLVKYADLWFLLNCEFIGLHLIWVTETGDHLEVDLCAVFYGEVLGYARDDDFTTWIQERRAVAS